MICPNCKFLIENQKMDIEAKKKVLELRKKGYSMRDISQYFDNKISLSTVQRFLKINKLNKQAHLD